MTFEELKASLKSEPCGTTLCHKTDHDHRWFWPTETEGLTCEYCEALIPDKEAGEAVEWLKQSVAGGYKGIMAWLSVQHSHDEYEAMVQAAGDFLWENQNNCSFQSEQPSEVNSGIKLQLEEEKMWKTWYSSHINSWLEKVIAQQHGVERVQEIHNSLSCSTEESDPQQLEDLLASGHAEDLTSLDSQFPDCIQSQEVHHFEYCSVAGGNFAEPLPAAQTSSPLSVPTTGQLEAAYKSRQAEIESLFQLEWSPIRS